MKHFSIVAEFCNSDLFPFKLWPHDHYYFPQFLKNLWLLLYLLWKYRFWLQNWMGPSLTGSSSFIHWFVALYLYFFLAFLYLWLLRLIVSPLCFCSWLFHGRCYIWHTEKAGSIVAFFPHASLSRIFCVCACLFSPYIFSSFYYIKISFTWHVCM